MLDIETQVVSPAARRTVGAGDISRRFAGLGALTFMSIVILQNVIRGATAPANGASSQEVLAHYTDHRLITFVLVDTYVLSAVGLFVFLGGAMRRLTATSRRGWAFTGLAGATCIIALFSVVVGTEEALSVVAHGDEPSLAAIGALWALHNSVFTCLELSIAAALLGLSRAGVAAGVTPAIFTRLAPVGAVLLLVGTLAGPAVAGGGAVPLFAVSVVGFLVWLAFLGATGVRMVRTGDRSETSVEVAR